MTEIISSPANYFNNNGKSAANASVRLRILVKSCSSAWSSGEFRARSVAAHRWPAARWPLRAGAGQIGACRSLSCAGQPFPAALADRAFEQRVRTAIACPLNVLTNRSSPSTSPPESSRITTIAFTYNTRWQFVRCVPGCESRSLGANAINNEDR